MIGWITSFLKKKTDPVAGMNAEEAAAYFAKKAAEAEAAQKAADAKGPSWPAGELHFKTRTFEQSTLLDASQRISFTTEGVRKQLDKMKELLDGEPEAHELGPLVARIDAAQNMLSEFKEELQRILKLMKAQQEKQVIKIMSKETEGPQA